MMVSKGTSDQRKTFASVLVVVNKVSNKILRLVKHHRMVSEGCREEILAFPPYQKVSDSQEI